PTDNTINLATVQPVTLPSNIPTFEQPVVVTPTITPAPTNSDLTTDSLSTNRASLQSEIKTLEDRIANRSTQQESLYQEAGLYEDIKALNELKASLGLANAESTRVTNEGLA